MDIACRQMTSRLRRINDAALARLNDWDDLQSLRH
jgi:hypothetical protein